MTVTPNRPGLPSSGQGRRVSAPLVNVPSDGVDLPPTTPGAPRDPDALRSLLTRIDVEGWEGPSATALLGYIRETIVRPLTIDLGMRGRASGEAEASAWEDVWELLREPAIRTAVSPWGLIWAAARHAILSEAVCARFPTSRSRAWRLARAQSAGQVEPIARLDDVAPDALPVVAMDGAAQPSSAVAGAVDALTRVGWSQDRAAEIVEDVLDDTPTTRGMRWTTRAHGWTSYGWRGMAERLDLPPWQARRLVIVLRGTAERPGLLPRLILAGGNLDIDVELHAALVSTRIRSRLSPVLPAVDAEPAAYERAS